MLSKEFVIPKGGDLREAFTAIQRQVAIGRTKVTVAQALPRRSDDQNRLLWKLYSNIIEIGGEAMAGWTKEDIHELMLGMHFGWQVVKGFGQTRKKPMRRSSRLSKMEFAEFVDFIVRYMAEQGVYLQLPGDLQQ